MTEAKDVAFEVVGTFVVVEIVACVLGAALVVIAFALAAVFGGVVAMALVVLVAEVVRTFGGRRMVSRCTR
jgi:hypothetical protein